MVAIRYFADRRPGGLLGSFSGDLRAAHGTGGASASALRGLVFDHLETRLRRKSDAAMDRYLGRRAVWRRHGPWKVFKTVDTPCLAFTAQLAPGGEITIVALAVCADYPGGDAETWWRTVVEPRVSLL